MPNKQQKNDAPTFEESLVELERIVNELETGELGLGQALEAYEQGIGHLKLCHQLLEQAERRIELLSGVDADGNAIAEPFDEHVTEELAQRASSRSRKRTAAGKPCAPAKKSFDAPSVDDPESLF